MISTELNLNWSYFSTIEYTSCHETSCFEFLVVENLNLFSLEMRLCIGYATFLFNKICLSTAGVLNLGYTDLSGYRRELFSGVT